jgi:hypothetical protein
MVVGHSQNTDQAEQAERADPQSVAEQLAAIGQECRRQRHVGPERDVDAEGGRREGNPFVDDGQRHHRRRRQRVAHHAEVSGEEDEQEAHRPERLEGAQL